MALRHLERHGLRLLVRNYRTPRGEIDLVMTDGPSIVFVEVRSRSRTSFMHPCESIDARKQQRIALAALHFLQRSGRYADAPCRFDAVLLSGRADDPEIEWITGAFEA